jgi:cytoskeletal protein RodZ
MAYSGSQLKKIRVERNISLEQVATATRIRLAILQDLEDEEYSELSSSTQTKGFLKLYADFLGLKEELAEESPIESAIPDLKPEVPEEKPFVEKEKEKRNLFARPAKPSGQPSKTPEQEPGEIIEQPAVKDAVDASTESIEALMSIGRELAARRRYLNITWDVIEEETHIPKDQLKSIERGDLDAFINPMQFRGHLHSYARFLNLDVAGIMIRYADAIQKRRLEKNTTKTRLIKAPRILPPFLVNLKRFFTLDLFFGSLMILGIVGFLIWGISRMTFLQEEPEVTGTLPAVADVLLSEPTIISTEIKPTLEEEVAQILPTPTPFYAASETDSNLEIVLLVRQNVWLRVTSDGDVIFQGRQLAGNVLTYTGDEEIELETGNISAIEIIFNQRTVDPISEALGTAARLLFTTEGMTELSVFDIDENP